MAIYSFTSTAHNKYQSFKDSGRKVEVVSNNYFVNDSEREESHGDGEGKWWHVFFRGWTHE